MKTIQSLIWTISILAACYITAGILVGFSFFCNWMLERCGVAGTLNIFTACVALCLFAACMIGRAGK